MVNALKGLFVAALVERERERTWRIAEEEREAKDGMLLTIAVVAEKYGNQDLETAARGTNSRRRWRTRGSANLI